MNRLCADRLCADRKLVAVRQDCRQIPTRNLTQRKLCEAHGWDGIPFRNSSYSLRPNSGRTNRFISELRRLTQLFDDNIHFAEKGFDTANSNRTASALKLKAPLDNLMAAGLAIE